MNDTFGHAAGDAVLVEVADRIRVRTRTEDTVARLGGDEFVILLPNTYSDRAEVAKLADRLEGSISAPIEVGARTVSVGASLGIAFPQPGGEKAEVILARADAAAYRVKSARRGRPIASILALVFLALVSPLQAAASERADVLVQAGHEGRPASCARFPGRACNLGASGERAATPIVADEATRVLRAAGLRVVRVAADYAEHYDVSAAVFLHFDGASPACTTGASIGYPVGSSDSAAREWRALYASVFPFRFMPDNFTRALGHYYGYRSVGSPSTEVLLELGEITCPAQRAWLQRHERDLGRLIAHFVATRLGRSDIPMPSFEQVVR